MKEPKHDPKTPMCGCLACWRADVADEEQRKKKREDAVIAEAFAIIQRRKKATECQESEPEPDPGGKGMSKHELKTRFGL